MSEVVGEAYVLLRPKADGRFQADTSRILGGLSFGGLAKGAGAATLGVIGVSSAIDILHRSISAVVMGGASFETELNTFQAVTGASAARMAEASKAAIALGQDVKLPSVSAADAAVAMTELAKGGLSVQDSLDGVRGSLHLATAANTDFGTSAQVIARNLSAFDLSGKNATRVADLLAGASIAATGEVSDMAIALQQSATVAHQAGISIDDTVTAIAELAKSGLVGSDAGTSLRTMILRLIPTTNKAANEMHKLGIKVLDLHGSLLPLPQVAENYRKALAPLSQAQRQAALNTIFGQDAIRSAAIFASGGSKAFAELAKTVTKKGQADVLTTARTKGLAGSLGALQSNLETIAIQISAKVNPRIKQFVDLVNQGLSALPATFSKLREAFQVGGLTGGLDAIKATFVTMAPAAKVATIAIAGVAIAVAALAASAFPITATVLAVGGLALAFKYAYDHSQRFRDAIDQVKQTVLSAGPVWDQFRQTVETAIAGAREVVAAGARYIAAIWSVVGHRVTIIVKSSFGAALDHIRNVLKEIQGTIDVFVGVFTGNWGKAWGGLKEVAKAGLDDVVGVVRFWGDQILGLFSGVWKSVEEESLRAVETVLKLLAKVPTRFSVGFGKHIGVKNPAQGALESVRGMLAGIRDKRQTNEIADAVAKNTAAALSARTADLTTAVELPAKKAVAKVADKVAPAAHEAGAKIGDALNKGMTGTISTSGENAIRALEKRLQDAVTETSRQVKEAVLGAQRNLESIGTGLASQIGQVIDNGPLGKALKRLQDQLAGQQAKTQGRQLRQAIVDSQNALATAAGKRLPGVRPDSQAVGLKAAVAAAKKDLADAQDAIITGPNTTKAQRDEIATFLKPQLTAYKQAQNALGTFIRGQRATLKTSRGAFRDFSQQTVVAGLQQQQANLKAQAEKRVATLTDQFNRGLISEDVFSKGIAKVLEGQASAFTVAGRTLGGAFAFGFNDTVAGLLLQAQTLQKARDKGLPGFVGQGSRPEIVEPLTVLGKQLDVQREIRDELRRTRTQQQAAADKAATKKAGKSTGVDLSGLSVGSTG